LVDAGDSVDVQVFGSEPEASASHPRGLRRLLALDLPSPAAAALRSLDNQQRLALGAPPHAGGTAALLADCLDAVLDDLIGPDPTQVRGAAAYGVLLARVRPLVPGAFAELVAQVAAVLTQAQQVRSQLRGLTSLALLPALSDVQAQLTELLPDGFVTRTGVHRLPDLSRYLRAIQARLDRLPDRPRPDDAAMGQIHHIEAEARQALARLPESRRHSPAAADIGWMLQELRVSLFAPTVRTGYPISDKRIRRALAALADG
jgi:ATP-dependent helicase HrpA